MVSTTVSFSLFSPVPFESLQGEGQVDLSSYEAGCIYRTARSICSGGNQLTKLQASSEKTITRVGGRKGSPENNCLFPARARPWRPCHRRPPIRNGHLRSTIVDSRSRRRMDIAKTVSPQSANVVTRARAQRILLAGRSSWRSAFVPPSWPSYALTAEVVPAKPRDYGREVGVRVHYPNLWWGRMPLMDDNAVYLELSANVQRIQRVNIAIIGCECQLKTCFSPPEA